MSVLSKHDFYVADAPLKVAQAMVARLHYARGGSNTACYVHGLYDRQVGGAPIGVAWWLPPTRVACESVNRDQWQKVLGLTRLVLEPFAPKNAFSFLLGRSVRLIRADARFVSLVTYADERVGHDGHAYRASGWDYVGRTGPYPAWADATGRQVAAKATKNRTRSEMEALGYVRLGSFYKHKFVKHLF